MTQIYALGLGIGTKNNRGQWLEVFYPAPLLEPDANAVQSLLNLIGWQGGNTQHEITSDQLASLAGTDPTFGNLARDLADSKRPIVAVILETDTSPDNVPAAYLKLHLLSHRLCKPHETRLDGIFGVLPNVAWTSQGAVDLDELPALQLQCRLEGRALSVNSVDKFPRMTDYIVPKGVRIADTARVRLGAYLGEGTTVMHEGFINFNAGTLGTSMVEGRISAGVVVGEGSDLGGGCSTMGTLSGGGNIVISVGKGCLIGANAGIGIPLGDRCIVEAGLYITAGTKVVVLDADNKVQGQVKARDLAGKNDLLLRRNSLNGAVECKTNLSAIALNEALHVNN